MKERYIDNALGNGKSSWWRYLVGLIVIVLFYFLGQFPLGGLMLWAESKGYNTADFTESYDFSLINVNDNIGLIFILMAPVFGFLGIIIVNKLLHQRPNWSLLSFSPNFRWNKFFIYGGLWFLLTLIIELGMYFFHPEQYQLTFNASKFLPLVFIVLLLIPLQTSFEELLFRSYLMQGLYNLFKNPIVPILVTSILFGLLHGLNPEVQAFGFWKMMIYYIGFGLFMGIVSVLDRGIEIALGIHAFNNIYGSLMVTFPESALQTSTIFTATQINIDAMIIGWLIISTAFFAFLYKTNNWDYKDLFKSYTD